MLPIKFYIYVNCIHVSTQPHCEKRQTLRLNELGGNENGTAAHQKICLIKDFYWALFPPRDDDEPLKKCAFAVRLIAEENQDFKRFKKRGCSSNITTSHLSCNISILDANEKKRVHVQTCKR